MISTIKDNILPCPYPECKEKFHPKGTIFCPYTGKAIPNNEFDNVSREREKVDKSKRKRIQFDFGIIGKVFLWSYNLILFVAGAFGVVLFTPDLVIGFSVLIILECIYLLFASSNKGFQKYIDKEK